ncbi:crotonase/enoyl-CoA hydratase family protein [Aquihabitans daechungensis]|uniref:crotonase/enoyl-CoA hydratase family protein n=1 Tax=Aquihabitans daechungensis TaxID=1052257 RepID=UPI003BA367CF
MTDETLPTYRLDDGVAIITLDDGKANAFSTAAIVALEAHLDQAAADGARSLVIIGRPGRFSAGFDLDEMTSGTTEMRALVVRGARFWIRLYGLGIPTVAACTGHALAGGAITLLACDLRIAADVPAKIGLNEVAIGLTLPKFAYALAADRLETTALVASTLGAQLYDVPGALAAGYVDRVVAPDDLLATAVEEARRLGGRRPPRTPARRPTPGPS